MSDSSPPRVLEPIVSGIGSTKPAESKSTTLYSAIAVATGAVFIGDLFTPLGIAVWVAYLIPVGLTLWTWRPQLPLFVAAATTVLIVIGYVSDSAGISPIVAQVNRGFGVFTVWMIAFLGYFFILNKLAVRRHQWLQAAQSRVSAAMAGEQRVEQLGENVLRFLAEYVDAHAGACFVREEGVFRRVATYGVPSQDGVPERFMPGDGLLGQAVKDSRIFILKDVPDGYLTVGSSLGRSKPRQLLIGAVQSDDSINGVIELGFVHPVMEPVTALFERLAESISVAIRSAQYRAHLQNLLEETQRQAEELQAQSEELRVANEELEEQGRAIRESQTRLEEQQAELEQTNSQLEEQTQLLESQRDDLAKAQGELERRAAALEQAGRYKSDFLANMSHELRTPLNSSLILAKLLADNPQKNLTPEQVKYAETISAAGNDLLSLINDVLDLSKIEAGHMEMRPEPVAIAQIVGDTERMFRPIVEQKSLQFSTEIDDDCPETIDTDRQRLEQVLKNLLSNAVKFTEKGGVTLSVRRAPGKRVEFIIADTGIGIPEPQQQTIFEAFRQADGTTHRKYGGTGLGLSISRELSRLLGGEISLTSAPGRGSTFTVSVPAAYDPSMVAPRPAPTAPHASAYLFEGAPGATPTAGTAPISIAPPERSKSPSHIPPPRVEDDRERLTGDGRFILAVEDDERFARILYDLAHEMRFQCLLATTGEEALLLAEEFLPRAIMLDVKLPDQSGLAVLDRLKHNNRTRHIPVHVVSVSDYTHTALSLGAVGYMLKPVKREELVDALQSLETRFAQQMRRVLVVEDDPVQLDGVRQLLGSQDVLTVGVRTAAECLAELKNSTFDCMVLDLSLPDASGYSLLETLSRDHIYSFPPVIVYTGRDLTADQEQMLRRYSQSIIIKGAKSPERLLDEVTLFLHQVVSELPPEQQKLIEKARSRDAVLEGRRILVAEDDVRNVFALTSILEPRGAIVQIVRNGREAVEAVTASRGDADSKIDLVLMDVMMPEMDGLTATAAIRSKPEFRKLPIITLTAKAMKDDQDRCIAAGANDYMAKPLDVEKLLSLIRVWMPR